MEESGGNSKRGLILAVVALVLVLAGGGAAYAVLLSKGSGAQNAESTAGTTSQSSAAQSSAAQSDDVSSNGAQDGANPTNMPMLSDYDATVYTESGEALKLSQIAANKPLVVNYWATWCPYCVEEMPDYQQIYDEYKDKVSFAFVDCPGGRGETVQKAVAWLNDNGFSELPAYFDNDHDAVYTYGIRSYPTSMVVDAEGKILNILPGKIDADGMRAVLNDLV